MKKLPKKKYFVPLLVVAIMLIAAAGAYAVWANQDSLDGNTISTGGVDITASDTAMHFDGLMPGAQAPAQFMWVRNDSTVPIMMYAYVRVTEGDAALTNYVKADITLAPPDFPTDAATLASSLGRDQVNAPNGWPVYNDVLAGILGVDNGKAHLRTLTPSGVPTPMDPNQYALYKVVLTLDPNTPDTFQNKTVKCDVVFVGGQVNGASLEF